MERLIAAAGNLKNQSVLSVAYRTGTRASEIVTLKVDIDSQRMTLRIKWGKGDKVRFSLSSPVLIECLLAFSAFRE